MRFALEFWGSQRLTQNVLIFQMKYVFIMLGTLGLLCGAYFKAQTKINRRLNLTSLKLGMTSQQVETVFGVPSAQHRNQLTYIFENDSELTITFRDEIVASAKVKFHEPLKISDPEIRLLTLVQMDSDSENLERPSWFFAGKPEEGLIYKITADGVIESLTWVPPFSYHQNQAKHLQALMRDFHNQHVTNM